MTQTIDTDKITHDKRTTTTVGEARQVLEAGTHIHWRPNGKINYAQPDTDEAIIIS
jgi:hypothetical protein